MNLPELSVKRPVTVVMVALALVVFGVISLRGLGIDLMPEITPPGISVLVPYPGASASDVESDVIEYLEDRLSTVNNLDHLASIAKDNVGVVTCQFKWGTNLDVASSDIRDKLDLAKTDLSQHAPDAEEPFVFKFTSAMSPVMFIAVGATESYKQLYQIVDKDIADPLRRVEGVGAIIIYGGLRRQINVEFDKQRLEAFKLPLSQVIQALAAENLDLPAGSVKMGSRDYHLRVPGRFTSLEEIKSVIVANRGGKPIYLRDIAVVQDSFEEPKMYASSNGKDAAIMLVQKQSGTNTVAVARRIRERLDALKKTLPPDVTATIPMDSSEDILSSIRNLATTMITASILVMIVTFLFLSRIAPTLIIVSVIPFSLVASLIFLYVRGYTINIVSLMSLSICLGMVVDNAIVVLENITRHVDDGERPTEAAVFGASEVGTAITASTLTTVVVFAPLIFISGIAGIVFKQLGAVITITLGSSLLASLTLTPMLGARFITRERSFGPTNGAGQQLPVAERWYRSLERAYGRLIRAALSHRLGFVGILTAIFGGSLVLVPRIGTELFPEMDTGEISLQLELEESTRVERTAEVTDQLSKLFTKLVPKETESYYGFVGETENQIGVALGMAEGANIGEIGAKLVSKTQRRLSAKEIAELLRREVRKVPGIQRLNVTVGSMLRQILLGGAKPLSVEIVGHDLAQISALANQLKAAVEKIPGAVDVTTSEKMPRTEIWVKVDREKAAQLGVSTAAIASTLRANYYGYEATKYRDAGDDFNVYLRLNPTNRSTLDEIGDITVPSVTGALVRLSNVARVEMAEGPIWIDRKDRERVIKVEADTFRRSLGEIRNDVEPEIRKLDVPPGITVRFGGTAEEQSKAFADIRLMLVVGVLLVYMVMAGQFESLTIPFVIMFSVPYAFTGAIWALVFTRTPINLVALIGLVLLVGVVVNNAIVLVDYTNILRARGYGLNDALITAGTRRLRPVLMTTLTTIFGLVPLAISRGQGSEMWQPFGITVIGGLSLSTIVTLALVPVMYSFMARRIRGFSA